MLAPEDGVYMFLLRRFVKMVFLLSMVYVLNCYVLT